jgi:hypothetical protein
LEEDHFLLMSIPILYQEREGSSVTAVATHGPKVAETDQESRKSREGVPEEVQGMDPQAKQESWRARTGREGRMPALTV